MKPLQFLTAITVALAASSLPFSALAQQSAPKAAAGVEVPVAEAIDVTDYQILLKSYGKTLFQSGTAQLSAPGEKALDQLAAALRKIDYRMVDIAGHADPTGSGPYNMQLAKARAAAVRTYLAKRGVNAQRIFTDARPIHAMGKCASEKGEALMNCLAPDRSADVKVLAKASVEVTVTETMFDRVEPVSAY
jgi:OmpA-OmpF porin, OOP family